MKPKGLNQSEFRLVRPPSVIYNYYKNFKLISAIVVIFALELVAWKKIEVGSRRFRNEV